MSRKRAQSLPSPPPPPPSVLQFCGHVQVSGPPTLRDGSTQHTQVLLLPLTQQWQWQCGSALLARGAALATEATRRGGRGAPVEHSVARPQRRRALRRRGRNVSVAAHYAGAAHERQEDHQACRRQRTRGVRVGRERTAEVDVAALPGRRQRTKQAEAAARTSC